MPAKAGEPECRDSGRKEGKSDAQTGHIISAQEVQAHDPAADTAVCDLVQSCDRADRVEQHRRGDVRDPAGAGDQLCDAGAVPCYLWDGLQLHGSSR